MYFWLIDSLSTIICQQEKELNKCIEEKLQEQISAQTKVAEFYKLQFVIHS